MDDIKPYLEKLSSVFNGLSTIDRSFLNMEILKFFVCAATLIGIHITGPYQFLLIKVDTSYDTLLQAFPTLYQDLNNIKGAGMLNTEKKCLTFLKTVYSKSHWQKSVYYIALTLACVKKEVANTLNELLPMLAEGFSIPCGALFGFGWKGNESAGTLLKLSAASTAVKEKLNKALIQNLNEERSVGFVTHEVNI